MTKAKMKNKKVTNLLDGATLEQSFSGEAALISTLNEADELINGPRRAEYGPVQESFRQIAMIASIGTRKHLSPADIAKIMLAVKYVREAQAHKRDNLVDLNGYSDLLNQLHELGVANIHDSEEIRIVKP